ncbi:hypothetical protein C8A00DRAFT_37243 [Chaetomidium leptoderma]|uniref:Uncharacterized protein n=1 Tax=Chaetomidium leptoderma TaxID=669021 RepID=A0AAN6VET6_9PEZI|nr:hypothetical protein C8A00DRAFT_37243 [Chaetomidium leptoderma]
MDAGPGSRQCSPALHRKPSDPTPATSPPQFFPLQTLASSKLSTLNNLSPSYLDILSTMSGTSGSSSSRDWNDVLKHGSALGILKPDVAFPPYGGSSTSGGTSSGGSSGGTTYPSGGSSGGTKP